MQMICEAYDMMRNLLGMKPAEMAEVFKKWNKGVLNSYLIEITAEVLGQADPETGAPLVDIILDAAGQKGTGKWTSVSALDMGVPAATIAEAVFARCISAIKEERVSASKQISGPALPKGLDKEEWLKCIHDALYCAKICSYAQGFQLMKAAEDEYGWKLNFGEIAMIWRGGCIIRAGFLQKIKEAYDREPGLKNLLLDPYFKAEVSKSQDHWRNDCYRKCPIRRASTLFFECPFLFRQFTALPICHKTCCRANATISALTPTNAPTKRAA